MSMQLHNAGDNITSADSANSATDLRSAHTHTNNASSITIKVNSPTSLSQTSPQTVPPRLRPSLRQVHYQRPTVPHSVEELPALVAKSKADENEVKVAEQRQGQQREQERGKSTGRYVSVPIGSRLQRELNKFPTPKALHLQALNKK